MSHGAYAAGGASAAGQAEADRIAVIIPHLNTPVLLARCLDSVLRQQIDFGRVSVVVVDNGSKEPLDEMAAAYPSVRFLREPTPGPGPARNLGASTVDARTLAFIDADCWAGDGWLQAAVDAVEARPGNAVIGGDVRIGVQDHSKITGLEAYESVFAFRQQQYIKKKGFSGTGNLAISREVFEQVGPFGGIEIAEDLDWGQRARNKGFPARYEPKMVIYHPSRGSLDELKDKWRRHLSHAYVAHVRSGKPSVRWYLLAAAVLLSSPIHALKILAAPRLGGVPGKLRGVATLFAIRTWRASEMLSVRTLEKGSGSATWNRST